MVAPGARRRGVGTALFVDTSRWAAERGLSGLDVWVDESDPDAPAYWGNQGYRAGAAGNRPAAEGPAHYPTGYFDSREQIYEWFAGRSIVFI